MMRNFAPFRPLRADWAQAGMAAAALFVLYAATSSRTVALEDDGLFVLAAYYMGGAHPPGYPLFVLIGKLFTYLPLGSVAYRVHLASAFFGALTCGALWLCARALGTGRLAAWLAALGLGLSPVFWSQAIIAEVYTLNAFFFVILTLLALITCPPGAESVPAERSRLLPWIALVYGLSLSNHWPLMGLSTPALAVLLWPRRLEILRRLPLLALLATLGLLPYAWMIFASLWSWQPISYHGPLLTLTEIWHVLSRAGYADVDDSASAGWIDRLRFFQFQGAQVMMQFAVAGSLLAIFGAILQKRLVGGRVALSLVLAFLIPTFVLLLLLNFDYDAVTKHIFHVYPLPAYAALALWMALGFELLRERYRPGERQAAGATIVLLALVAAVGSRTNLGGESWGVRYAQTILHTLPKDAVLFVKGDVDMAPIGYFYLIEGQRPDIELYHASARVLGNRLFPPLRTNYADAQKAIEKFIDSKTVPVAFTLDFWDGYARRDRWLYIEVDKSSRDTKDSSIDIPEESLRFFEESVATSHDSNAWVAFYQDELRRRYGTLLGQQLPRSGRLDERRQKHLALLSANYFGAIGVAQGLLGNKNGYSTGAMLDLLERARVLMPSDATKAHRSVFFRLRGLVRLDMGDKAGAISDLQTAIDVWPRRDNLALTPLTDLYKEAGDKAALEALENRMKRRR